jgi:hypothetical protein
MKTKKYSSYAQINYDLDVLKLEREIHLQKTILNLEKMKSCLNPNHILKNMLDSFMPVFSNSYLKIIIKFIPLLIMWFTKRKRG